MATSDRSKPSRDVPSDLLSVVRSSGVLGERQLAEIKAKVLHGDYPIDSVALAGRLVKEKILTEYQTKRFLSNKPHGLVVGRYVIVDRLGSGSMGRVYKAHHVMMERYVALKIIAPEIVTNERVVARFQREMRLVGRLDHPNVIRAFDADQINRLLYIVMEYVQGESLAQRLRRSLIPPLEMAGYAAQASLGLAHAHSQGIVHRDVKPSNLLLTEDRQIKVLDLGLGVLMEADDASSFATADGIAVGTVDYMSPEQACGREVDGRSDLYSLACSMYHLMTGKLAFPGDSPIERMGKRISGRPVPILEARSDIPPALVRVIDRLLANKPQDRYQTAQEVADALQAVARPKTRHAPSRTDSRARSGLSPAPRPDAQASSAVAPASAAPVAPAPERVIETIAPKYPGWFRPLAALTERRPVVALMTALATLAVTFGVGFLLGRLLH
jgi:eukaryotic-like serine/threonine-protein kinase